MGNPPGGKAVPHSLPSSMPQAQVGPGAFNVNRRTTFRLGKSAVNEWSRGGLLLALISNVTLGQIGAWPDVQQPRFCGTLIGMVV